MATWSISVSTCPDCTGEDPKGSLRKSSFGYLRGVTELETHQITDAREMRALAHPLRLRLIGLLRLDGPATASALADDCGRHSGARELPPAPARAVRVRGRGPGTGRDGRERWWRAAQARTSWDSAAFLDTPDRIAALSSLHREQFLALRSAGSTNTCKMSPRSTPTGSPRPTTATTSSSSTPTDCAR